MVKVSNYLSQMHAILRGSRSTIPFLQCRAVLSSRAFRLPAEDTQRQDLEPYRPDLRLDKNKKAKL